MITRQVMPLHHPIPAALPAARPELRTIGGCLANLRVSPALSAGMLQVRPAPARPRLAPQALSAELVWEDWGCNGSSMIW